MTRGGAKKKVERREREKPTAKGIAICDTCGVTSKRRKLEICLCLHYSICCIRGASEFHIFVDVTQEVGYCHPSRLDAVEFAVSLDGVAA